MSDSDPRPMPVEVLRAYREPVNLRDMLTMWIVYDEKDRRDVVDALMRSLLEKYGDVWIDADGREVRVSSRVKQMKKNALTVIEQLLSIEEYGGGDGVLPLLAQAMQPRWAQWWVAFKWSEWGDVRSWSHPARCVLGRRQFSWLSAQYARTVIDLAMLQNRAASLAAIEAAETWSKVPSRENLNAAKSASRVASSAAWGNRNAVWYDSAAYAAAHAVNIANSDTDVIGVNSAYDAVRALTSTADGRADAYARLADLTRSLITPTLVTSASHGLRSGVISR